jgi:hypothetical protein
MKSVINQSSFSSPSSSLPRKQNEGSNDTLALCLNWCSLCLNCLVSEDSVSFLSCRKMALGVGWHGIQTNPCRRKDSTNWRMHPGPFQLSALMCLVLDPVWRRTVKLSGKGSHDQFVMAATGWLPRDVCHWLRMGERSIYQCARLPTHTVRPGSNIILKPLPRFGIKASSDLNSNDIIPSLCISGS